MFKYRLIAIILLGLSLFFFGVGNYTVAQQNYTLQNGIYQSELYTCQHPPPNVSIQCPSNTPPRLDQGALVVDFIISFGGLLILALGSVYYLFVQPKIIQKY